MKLLCYGDLQATDGDELCFTRPNTTLQHYRVEKFFEDVAKIYADNHCDGVVDLGDTTDDRSSIPLPTLEVLGSGIAKLPEGKHWKLTGNHEQYLRDATVNNRRLFDHRFHVIDGCEIVESQAGYAIYFASFPADHAALTEWIAREGRKYRGPKILFGHFQVEGAYYQAGTALTGVPQSVLQSFSLVLLGHIHLPQAVTNKIHYVGSPFQQDWGETGQNKRVAIVNTKTMTVQWVPLTGYPEYRSVSLAEFTALAGEASEHRYRVKLNSHEETEQFFQHPHFNRATAEYNYDETPAEQSAEVEDWSFEGTCRRYLKTVPPGKVGINLTDDEMVEMTKLIIG